MKKKVIHYLDSDTFGGCEEVVLQLLAGLDKEKWQPVLFHHDKPGIARLLDEAKRLEIPCRIVPEIVSKDAAVAIWEFARVLREVRPDIFHAHLNWPLGCRHGLAAAKFGRIPGIVATAHLYSPIDGVRFAKLKWLLHAATVDRYIAVSNEVSERFSQSLGLPGTKIRVVHNGIRQTAFGQPPDPAVRATLTEGSDCPIVFTPARLHSQKGHKYLLEAAAMIPDAVFVLAGDGPERDFLEQYSSELGIQARVRFLGNRQDVPQLMAACDLFVLPSLYEGLPISVLEAMAAGKPIVATNIGGTDEAIVNNETGLLVPSANAQELALAIKRLLLNRDQAARFALAGKARAKSMFSQEAMAKGVMQVYDELLS